MTEASLNCLLPTSMGGIRQRSASSNDAAKSSGKKGRTKPLYQIRMILIPSVVEYL